MERNATTTVITEFGAHAVPALIEALASPQAAVRTHAADVLCFIGEPDAAPAIDALGQLLADQDQDVAVAALMALPEQSAESAAEFINATVGDDRKRLSAVAKALAERR